ncbi:MAG: GNAT family N-acetyltransferase [Thermomicrobiales bacterium]
MTIRSVRLPEDRASLLALDRSFVTDRVYRVAYTADAFTLEEVPAQPPLRKEFPLADDLGADRAWEQGFVAERAASVIGFAAFTHRRWNRRTELWHLYVASHQRGQGVGRTLIEAVVAAARDADMRCVWLETSNLAYPAIQFYRRVGFNLCGLDVSLYDPASEAAGETALYFMRPL